MGLGLVLIYTFSLLRFEFPAFKKKGSSIRLPAWVVLLWAVFPIPWVLETEAQVQKNLVSC